MNNVLGTTADWIRRTLPHAPSRERPTQRSIFTTALWLGCIGFGGGISVLAQIDTEVVKKRGWLTPREFANTLTVSQMLPGGAAANALAYVGLRFGGWTGALPLRTPHLRARLSWRSATHTCAYRGPRTCAPCG